MLKRKYKVYLVNDGHGSFASTRTLLGTTYAVSAKQAESQVRYRTRGKVQSATYREDSHDDESYICEYYEAVIDD